jgi:hydrogenase maturation protease
MNALVIGYGNELRGDDGIGPYLARAVAERGWPGVRALAVHQLVPELVETIATANVVVFVDARRDGTVTLAVHRVEPGDAWACLGHCGDAAALLALCRDLYGTAPAAWFATVCGYEFGYVGSLSAAALAACRDALECIESLVHVQSADV